MEVGVSGAEGQLVETCGLDPGGNSRMVEAVVLLADLVMFAQ